MSNIAYSPILTSSASTSTRTSDAINGKGATGAIFYLDVTATPNDAQTLTFAVQGQDPVSNKWVTITAFTALTASNLGASPTTETYLYTVDSGAAETAAVGHHEVQALALPHVFRVVCTHSSSGSWTYTVGYQSYD